MISKIFGYFLFICGIVGITALGLKACDAEYENQKNKNIQWQKDIKDGKPFTDFSGG